MPAASQIHFDQALTNLLIMYRNDYYSADRILPILPVMKRSGRYFVYDRSAFLTGNPLDAQGRPGSLRAMGAEAAESDHNVKSNNFYAEEYAKRDIVPDGEIALADDPLAPEMDVTIQKTEELKIDNEVMVSKLVCTRGNYATANKVALTSGGTGTQWSNYAPNGSTYYSNPFTDIKNGKLAVLHGIQRNANMFAINPDAARALADHPLVKQLIQYVSAEALTMSGLPAIVRGLKIEECQAQYNTAPEGGAFAGGNIWQCDDATNFGLIFYSNPNPSPRSVSMGYTFEAPDDTTRKRGFSVRKWREDKRKGMMIEVSFLRDYRVTSVDDVATNKNVGGYLVSNAA